MNEKKGPFDAAINWIRKAITDKGRTWTDGEAHYPVSDFIGNDKDYEELISVLRILEIAGKVDKELAQFTLLDAGHGLAYSKKGMSQIVSLIQSLPDGEGEKK